MFEELSGRPRNILEHSRTALLWLAPGPDWQPRPGPRPLPGPAPWDPAHTFKPTPREDCCTPLPEHTTTSCRHGWKTTRLDPMDHTADTAPSTPDTFVSSLFGIAVEGLRCRVPLFPAGLRVGVRLSRKLRHSSSTLGYVSGLGLNTPLA